MTTVRKDTIDVEGGVSLCIRVRRLDQSLCPRFGVKKRHSPNFIWIPPTPVPNPSPSTSISWLGRRELRSFKGSKSIEFPRGKIIVDIFYICLRTPTQGNFDWMFRPELHQTVEFTICYLISGMRYVIFLFCLFGFLFTY